MLLAPLHHVSHAFGTMAHTMCDAPSKMREAVRKAKTMRKMERWTIMGDVARDCDVTVTFPMARALLMRCNRHVLVTNKKHGRLLPSTAGGESGNRFGCAEEYLLPRTVDSYGQSTIRRTIRSESRDKKTQFSRRTDDSVRLLDPSSLPKK